MRLGLAAVSLALSLAAMGCGGAREPTAVRSASDPGGDDWPTATPRPIDYATVEQVLASPDGAPVTLVGYLVAVKLPCPACNVGGPTAPRDEVAGRTSRPRGPAAPGCLPCPDPAATVGNQPPHAPEVRNRPVGVPPPPYVRAVGLAGALQPRHVNHAFLFIGVFHANGPDGPELEVKDIRAVDVR